MIWIFKQLKVNHNYKNYRIGINLENNLQNMTLKKKLNSTKFQVRNVQLSFWGFLRGGAGQVQLHSKLSSDRDQWISKNLHRNKAQVYDTNPAQNWKIQHSKKILITVNFSKNQKKNYCCELSLMSFHPTNKLLAISITLRIRTI